MDIKKIWSDNKVPIIIGGVAILILGASYLVGMLKGKDGFPEMKGPDYASVETDQSNNRKDQYLEEAKIEEGGLTDREKQKRKVVSNNSIFDISNFEKEEEPEPVKVDTPKKEKPQLNVAPKPSPSPKPKRRRSSPPKKEQPKPVVEEKPQQTFGFNTGGNLMTEASQEANSNNGSNNRQSRPSKSTFTLDKYIPVFVFTDQTITANKGVHLRVGESITIDGTKIPKNAFAYGVAKFSKERIYIDIHTFEWNGNTVNCSLKLYDNKYHEGIFYKSKTDDAVNSAQSDVATDAAGLLGQRRLESIGRTAAKSIKGIDKIPLKEGAKFYVR